MSGREQNIKSARGKMIAKLKANPYIFTLLSLHGYQSNSESLDHADHWLQWSQKRRLKFSQEAHLRRNERLGCCSWDLNLQLKIEITAHCRAARPHGSSLELITRKLYHSNRQVTEKLTQLDGHSANTIFCRTGVILVWRFARFSWVNRFWNYLQPFLYITAFSLSTYACKSKNPPCWSSVPPVAEGLTLCRQQCNLFFKLMSS